MKAFGIIKAFRLNIDLEGNVKDYSYKFSHTTYDDSIEMVNIY